VCGFGLLGRKLAKWVVGAGVGVVSRSSLGDESELYPMYWGVGSLLFLFGFFFFFLFFVCREWGTE